MLVVGAADYMLRPVLIASQSRRKTRITPGTIEAREPRSRNPREGAALQQVLRSDQCA